MQERDKIKKKRGDCYMKRTAAALLAAMLLFSCAYAHGVDLPLLLEGLEYTAREDLNGVDTMYRPASQPWRFETDNGRLRVYLDYVDNVTDDVLFLRLTLNFSAWEKLITPHITFTVDGKTWTATAETNVEEYDGTYYHDYMLYFTDETDDLLKAIIRAESAVTVDIDGLEPFHAELTLPAEEMADLYDRYVNAGGMHQHFEIYHSVWPLLESGNQKQ